jgi:hypothetical protein
MWLHNSKYIKNDFYIQKIIKIITTNLKINFDMSSYFEQEYFSNNHFTETSDPMITIMIKDNNIKILDNYLKKNDVSIEDLNTGLINVIETMMSTGKDIDYIPITEFLIKKGANINYRKSFLNYLVELTYEVIKNGGVGGDSYELCKTETVQSFIAYILENNPSLNNKSLKIVKFLLEFNEGYSLLIELLSSLTKESKDEDGNTINDYLNYIVYFYTRFDPEDDEYDDEDEIEPKTFFSKMIEILMLKGADPCYKNKEGKSAMDYIKKHKDFEKLKMYEILSKNSKV